MSCLIDGCQDNTDGKSLGDSNKFQLYNVSALHKTWLEQIRVYAKISENKFKMQFYPHSLYTSIVFQQD